MKVLIVDDSSFLRKKLCGLVESLGKTVVAEAVDGHDAIEKYKELKPDLVTMDMEMPIMNGVDASIAILQLDPKAKIVMITSSVDKKALLVCEKMGVKKVMQKPVNEEEFKKAIEAIS